MDRHWLRISLVAQILLAAYFQLVVRVPLGGWNYQPGSAPLLSQWSDGALSAEELLGSLLFLLPVVLFSIAFWRRYRWLMWVGLVGYSVWLILQIKTWWIAYLFGASDAWFATYQRVFSASTKVLPSFGRHLAPDGLHFVLQILLTATVVSLFLGLLASLRRSKSVHSAPASHSLHD